MSIKGTIETHEKWMNETAESFSGEKPSDRVVITNVDLKPGECSINSVQFTFQRGRATRVPVEVRDILARAGYLVHDEAAR